MTAVNEWCSPSETRILRPSSIPAESTSTVKVMTASVSCLTNKERSNAARPGSCELEGPVLREAQNGVDARRRERSRHARAGRAALVVAKADPGTARNGKTPVARRHFKTPIAGLNAKAASVPPSSHSEGKDLDETVGEKAEAEAGDRVDDAVGETGDLVLERAPDPEAELEASAFGPS